MCQGESGPRSLKQWKIDYVKTPKLCKQKIATNDIREG